MQMGPILRVSVTMVALGCDVVRVLCEENGEINLQNLVSISGTCVGGSVEHQAKIWIQCHAIRTY